MTKINQNTPVINQYHSIKNDHKDKILLFHLGDFYEMFFEDAEIVSKVLGLTLTYRKNGQEKIFMCGIPVANKDFYIKKPSQYIRTVFSLFINNISFNISF